MKNQDKVIRVEKAREAKAKLNEVQMAFVEVYRLIGDLEDIVNDVNQDPYVATQIDMYKDVLIKNTDNIREGAQETQKEITERVADDVRELRNIRRDTKVKTMKEKKEDA